VLLVLLPVFADLNIGVIIHLFVLFVFLVLWTYFCVFGVAACAGVNVGFI